MGNDEDGWDSSSTSGFYESSSEEEQEEEKKKIRRIGNHRQFRLKRKHLKLQYHDLL